jgi:hypothetical protein
LRAHVALHAAGDREAVLGNEPVERERLPEGRIVHDRSRLLHDQRLVDRRVGRVGVALPLV